MEAGVYVYGVIAATQAGTAGAAGVEGSDVRAVKHGRLAALVSDLTSERLAAARELRAHWQVLEKTAETTTVVPVRFATVMESDDAVVAWLAGPSGQYLEGLLGELEGRVQMTVKADYDEEQVLADIVKGSPAITALAARVRESSEAASYYDRIRLGEIVANTLEQRRQADTGLVLERLRPEAVNARAETVAGPKAAFHIAFLVERSRIEAFAASVAKLAADLGEQARMRLIGPLPPYSFAEIDVNQGAAAWA